MSRNLVNTDLLLEAVTVAKRVHPLCANYAKELDLPYLEQYIQARLIMLQGLTAETVLDMETETIDDLYKKILLFNELGLNLLHGRDEEAKEALILIQSDIYFTNSMYTEA